MSICISSCTLSIEIHCGKPLVDDHRSALEDDQLTGTDLVGVPSGSQSPFRRSLPPSDPSGSGLLAFRSVRRMLRESVSPNQAALKETCGVLRGFSGIAADAWHGFRFPSERAQLRKASFSIMSLWRVVHIYILYYIILLLLYNGPCEECPTFDPNPESEFTDFLEGTSVSYPGQLRLQASCNADHRRHLRSLLGARGVEDGFAE